MKLPLDDITISALQATMLKALVKYGDTTPLGDVLTQHEKFAVLVREVGEVAEDVPPYGAKAEPENLVGELLQVAAMALSWAQSLDKPGRNAMVPLLRLSGPLDPDKYSHDEDWGADDE